jgi:hypothetical protein
MRRQQNHGDNGIRAIRVALGLPQTLQALNLDTLPNYGLRLLPHPCPIKKCPHIKNHVSKTGAVTPRMTGLRKAKRQIFEQDETTLCAECPDQGGD